MKEYIKKYYKYYLIIIFIAIMLTSALLVNGLPDAHDVDAHMARAVGTGKALKEGQVPPLVVSDYVNGFGFAWNLFYPPLAPYIMTILKLFVATYQNALKLLIMIFMCISGIAMFKLMEEITGKKKVSLLASIIYMCAPYLLIDIYIRMAVGEILSYALFPVLFLGIHNLFYGSGKKHTLITVGAVGILLSHNISAIFAIGLSVIYVLFNIKRLNNKEIWKKIGINVVFIILIVGFFYLPLLQAKNSINYAVFEYGTMATLNSLKDNVVYLSQILFGKMQTGYSNPIIISKNVDWDMCMQIGLYIVIPLLFTPFVYKKIDKKFRKNYLLTLVIGLFAIFASTPLFPYNILPKQIAVIQFPWRFLHIATFALSIIATINIYKVFEQIRLQEIMIFTIIILVYISPLIFVNNFNTRITDEVYTGEEELNPDDKSTKSSAMLEYLPLKAYENIEYIKNRSQDVVVIEGNIQITEQNKNGSNMNIKFTNASNKSSIELPYIYYPGYEIKINGEKIDYYESENGFVKLDIPENTSGEIVVKYTGTILARITWLISLISLIVFIIYNINLCIKYKKDRKILVHEKD